MSFLVDTNVVSELRRGERAAPGVQAWFDGVDDDALFLSVLVVGELRRGVELVRRRDAAGANALEVWLRRVTDDFGARILPVTPDVADVWGRVNVPDPLPVIDSLLAATAIVHSLTVVTRNVGDIARTGVATIDPFSGQR